MRRLAILLLLVLAGCTGGGEHRLIVAAGTTLVDSGLLDGLVDLFESQNPEIELSVVGESTSQVLQLGRLGGADVLITHGPDLEKAFLDDGLAARYELVFVSSFVIVGPDDASEAGSAAEVLAAIANNGSTFVSRADGSGTHEIEMELWKAAGIDPFDEPWYLETGQGMGLTLQVADQRAAFTLAEWGTFLTAGETLSLRPLEVPDLPANPYHLTVVGSSSELAAAETFLDWLISPGGRAATAQVNRDLFGQIVYSNAG